MKQPMPSGAAHTFHAAHHATMSVPLLHAMRPKQWTKNAVLLAGIVFAGKLTDFASLWRAMLAVVIFCSLSSSVYLFNDLMDREGDSQHPIKRHRAIASGRLPAQTATIAALFLGLIACAGSIVLGLPFFGLAVGYVVLNLVYSWRLKHEVILDVFSLAGGFVIRAAAGAVAVSVPISPWLYVCTVLLALFLGLSKRRYELLLLELDAGSTRRSLEAYSTPLVEEMLGVVTSSTVIAYAMYTFFAENVPRNHSMMLTIPFVLYGLFRYLYLVHAQRGAGNPDEVLLRDIPLIIAIALWGLTAMIILYGARWTS